MDRALVEPQPGGQFSKGNALTFFGECVENGDHTIENLELIRRFCLTMRHNVAVYGIRKRSQAGKSADHRVRSKAARSNCAGWRTVRLSMACNCSWHEVPLATKAR